MKKVDIYCIIKFIFFNLNLFSLTVNVELALKTFRENVGKVTQLLCAAVPIIAKVDWSVTIQELKVKTKEVNQFR
jgi:hypothetical protein